ncbi:hypothetical protein [Sulfurimonas sp.]|jgi:hypothetical protein|uniref:hypothetical protein n=1 Tax=Sulfurimonas sp. TaxID=2022749 RepID=UPI0025D69A11|nr:hypothetical protein [Sulfurimonas sp.]MBT5935069.1 hypothetical protein [Sulfurimonas sp.]
MYTVQMEEECACFKKSEYANEKSFDNQQDAYNYANIVAEFMNEDFCTTHLFTSQMIGPKTFMIRVSANPNVGSSCGTDSSGGSCDTGSCGC